MAEPVVIPPPPPPEIWVGNGQNSQAAVAEMLKAIGEEYNYDVWLNGVKIHSATMGETQPDPKEA